LGRPPGLFPARASQPGGPLRPMMVRPVQQR
jgi:hypothetical protein